MSANTIDLKNQTLTFDLENFDKIKLIYKKKTYELDVRKIEKLLKDLI